jgi:pyridoxine 5-phosphate synthase
MRKLMVNIDHVATVREARKGYAPDPVYAAGIAEMAGASGIIVHLREDRRHIKDRDVFILRQVVRTTLNLEMAATEEMVRIAKEVRPDMVTLVPEKRQELTTEGGLDVAGLRGHIKEVTGELQAAGIKVSLFVDPDEKQIRAAKEARADTIEIHTGTYSDASTEGRRLEELKKVMVAAKSAKEMGFGVNAGHGLNYGNVQNIVAIPEIDELSIGHSIIARAVMVGFDQAIRDMLKAMEGW